MAHSFSEYFHEQIATIRQGFPDDPLDTMKGVPITSESPIGMFSCFEPLSREQIRKLISSAKPTTSAVDPAATNVRFIHRMPPGGVIVGDSGLCCCGPACNVMCDVNCSSAITSHYLLIRPQPSSFLSFLMFSCLSLKTSVTSAYSPALCPCAFKNAAVDTFSANEDRSQRVHV